MLSCGTVYYAVQDGSNFLSLSTRGNLKCDHSNESYRTVFSCDAVYYAVKGGSNFLSLCLNPRFQPFK